MAVVLPIITEFDGNGINKAVKQFKQLETTSEKAQFAIKKAAIPAAAALTAVVGVIGSSVKAAIEDEAAQESLARQIAQPINYTHKVPAGWSKEVPSSPPGRALG